MALIYCIEDDEGITELISCALKTGGYSVRTFPNAKEFDKVAYSARPDLILLDIMLPDEDGFSILKRLKSDNQMCEIPVIMLTARTGELDKVTGLEAGADDYITKPFGVMELLSRIKAVLRRVKKQDEVDEVRTGELVIDFQRRTVTYGDNPISLTYKEFELLAYLVQNKGIVVKREKLMERVWGYNYEGETRTLDMHIKTLRQKLEQGGCSDLIQTVRGVGYRVD